MKYMRDLRNEKRDLNPVHADFHSYFHLDLSKGHVDLFGCHYWEFRSPWQEMAAAQHWSSSQRAGQM